MAAHMQKIFKFSSIRLEKSWCLRKECALFQSLSSRLMSNSTTGTGTPPETPSQSSSSSDDVPNQTVVVENTLPQTKRGGENQRNIFKGLNLIKPDSGLRDESFATLFRESNFAHLGDPKGKTVVGKIFRVVGDDLYVDFDWKFPCVIKRPAEDAKLYVNNALVRLKIIDLEMSTIFLGAERETSLNEANCVLLDLISSPIGVPESREESGSYPYYNN